MRLTVGRFNVVAVLLGIGADWIGTVIASIVCSSALAVWLSVQGVAEDEIRRLLSAPASWPPRFQLLMVIVGLCWTGVGGFVAAKVAKQREIVHAAAVGVASCVTGLLLEHGTLPLWWWVMGYGFVLPVSALGGYVAAGGLDLSKPGVQ